MASGADRVSALPEDVLHNVLGFLPAQEVVRTCVLARRWRGVWRSVPALRFTGVKGWGSADRFAQFVDHLLHLRCAAGGAGAGAGAPLDSCDFDFDADGFMEVPANERHASHWMWQAAPRVRLLRLRVIEFNQEPSPLSDLHLVSQRLTRLELVGVGVNDSVVDFSGCPALVELRMEVCDVFVNQLLSPSLKHLRMARCFTSAYTRILLSLPSLVSLEWTDCQGRIPLLGSSSQVARVVVIFDGHCSDECSQGRFDDCGGLCDGCYYYYGDPDYGPRYDSNNSTLFKGLSQATDLELKADSDVIVFNRDLRWCPTFTKLKTLLLNDWCLAADHNALIYFLQHSPILEKLTLQLSKLRMEVCDVFVNQLLSPSLKHLRMARCFTSAYTRILLSLPSLVSVEWTDCQGRIPLLGSSSQVARAVVTFDGHCSDECSQGRFDDCGGLCDGCYYYYGDPDCGPRYDRNNSTLLKGLSQATDLELKADSDVIVFNRDLRWCPTFTKLKTLLLNDWCLAADHNALIYFLQHSPILEKLTLQLSKAPPNVTKTDGIYEPLGQSVASNSLKIVEIKCANVDRRVHKILNILTTYGIRLEKINIQHTSRISGSGCFNFVCTGFS